MPTSCGIQTFSNGRSLGKKMGGHSTLACVNLALEIVFPSTALDTKKKYVCEWVIKA